MSQYQNNLELFRYLCLSDAKTEYINQASNGNTVHMSFDDRLSLILMAEKNQRTNRRIKRKFKESHLKFMVSEHDFIFEESNRGITKSQLAELCQLNFIKYNKNLAVTGKTGVGKTYLLHLVAYSAIKANLTVRYHRLSALLELISIN